MADSDGATEATSVASGDAGVDASTDARADAAAVAVAAADGDATTDGSALAACDADGSVGRLLGSRLAIGPLLHAARTSATESSATGFRSFTASS
jgi:hypothetical protein